MMRGSRKPCNQIKVVLQYVALRVANIFAFNGKAAGKRLLPYFEFLIKCKEVLA